MRELVLFLLPLLLQGQVPSRFFVRSDAQVTLLLSERVLTANLPVGLTLTATGIIGRLNQPGEYLGTLELVGGPHPITFVSTPAVLPASRPVNLSLRAATSLGSNIATTGFVITGRKTVLLRLAGPGLQGFGVTGALNQPQLRLFRDAVLVVTLSAWGNDVDPLALAQAMSYVGAFPFLQGSSDAAAIVTLEAGNYTVQAIGAGETPGVGLIELYDLDRGPNGFVNLSSRAIVGLRENILIVGISIDGSRSRRVLIRAVGPSLSQFGVGNLLSTPSLAVFSTEGVIATNVGWMSSPEIALASQQAGAFPLRAESLDSAVIANLAPGTYTVQVSGVNQATGVALAEVYLLPE